MNKITYAPVLIPTLCRYDKFKACVESLANNTGADKTDLYIALDYPLKPEHWDGYNNISKYIESIIGFNSIIVIRREKNVGTRENIFSARNEILKLYDRYILTEDDNVFSPNFLEFINNGLIRFKDDKSILAICGYRHFYNIKFSDNNYFIQDSDISAWGYAFWRDKYQEMANIGTSSYFRKKLFNPIIFFSVWRRGGNQLLALMRAASKKRDTEVYPFFPDAVISVYMYLQKMYCVMPTVSKVRNTGFDGSGNSAFLSDELRRKHDLQEIDTEIHFTYQGEDHFINHNREVFRRENYGRISLGNVVGILISKLLMPFKK